MRAQRKCLLTALSAEIRTWLSRSWFYFCNNWQTGWHKCTRPIKEWGMVNQLNAISDYHNQLVANSSVHNKLKSKTREKLWRQCDWLNEAGRGILTAFTRVSWRMELSSIRPSLWLVGMIEKEKMTNARKYCVSYFLSNWLYSSNFDYVTNIDWPLVSWGNSQERDV